MKYRRWRMADLIVPALVCAMLLIVLGICWLQAYQESKTYNRLTGANTTAWDALWVELRVQGDVR